jgi:UDP-N-acetylmuramoylalanine--D-glutamate ligase
MHKNLHIVIGLGATGVSCIRFLTKRGIPVMAMDTRDAPPNVSELQHLYPDVRIYTGPHWPQEILNSAKVLVVSPGVSIKIAPIQEAKSKGVAVVGDIELFAQYNKAPVIAITGANGKSTVTTVVGEMAKCAGKKVAVVGNIGTPVLDIFQDNATFDLIVMELSSFQLETTHTLKPIAATVLNITPDHLDRYESFNDYVAAKHRIFHHAQHVIINKQDPLSDSANIPNTAKKWFFTTEEPKAAEFGLREIDGQTWLMWGQEKLISSQELKIVGLHNLANALSALALGKAAGLAWEPMLEALKNFNGLAHRCQWVAEKEGIRWINDSKGTNIGACQAALDGIGQQLLGKIVLLLGGDGKGADFADLIPQVAKYCRAIIVMGKDAPAILDPLGKVVEASSAQTMYQAVELAASKAKPGDCVLLSPACSSLDQYQNFSHRGEVFIDSVKKVLTQHVIST